MGTYMAVQDDGVVFWQGVWQAWMRWWFGCLDKVVVRRAGRGLVMVGEASGRSSKHLATSSASRRCIFHVRLLHRQVWRCARSSRRPVWWLVVRRSRSIGWFAASKPCLRLLCRLLVPMSRCLLCRKHSMMWIRHCIIGAFCASATADHPAAFWRIVRSCRQVADHLHHPE